MSRTITRPMVVGLATTVLVLAGYVGASCAPSNEATPSGGGGHGGTGKTASSTSTMPPIHCTPGMGPNGLWEPPEGCYRPVAWPDAGCHVEVALDPIAGAPPLVWVPCGSLYNGNFAGCEVAKVTWANPNSDAFEKGTVLRTAKGYRISMHAYTGTGDFAAIYDETEKAIAGWRAKNNHGATSTCLLWWPLLTDSGVWLGASNYDAGVSQYVHASWDSLTVASEPAGFHSAHQYWTAQDGLLLAWLVDAKTLEVVDSTNNTDGTLPGVFGAPQIVGDHVVALIFSEIDHSEVAVWSRQTGQVRTVFETVWPERVKVAASDGKNLAWIVQPGAELPGDLWTSPFAETKEALKPAKRRPTPAVQYHGTYAGGDYYAVHSHQDYKKPGPGDGKFHLYRLSDAREWIIEPIPYTDGDVLYVDDTYMFYQSPDGLTRVKIDALGPGTAPP